MGPGGAGRGEVAGEAVDDEAVEADRARDVLEALLAEVARGRVVEGGVDQVPRGLGQQGLAAVGRGADARREVHVPTHVTLCGPVGFAGVDAHAGAHRCVLGPGVRGKGALSLNASRHRVSSAREGIEEGVSLGVDLRSAMRGEGVPQEGAVGLQHLFVGGTEGVKEAGGALDVGEDEGDGS